MPDKTPQRGPVAARDTDWATASSLTNIAATEDGQKQPASHMVAGQSICHPDRIGKYHVETYLGGGMARVYSAKDPLLGKIVAVKVLKDDGGADPRERDRFLHEARIGANLEHPNIVTIYDFGEDESGRPYMVMEFLKGENLRTVITENRTGNFADKLRIALQTARALEYIHAHGILHRDIKPENVHINESGVVKLMDFGIARTQDLAVTRQGFMIGTPCYMAPEQVQGRQLTASADVYAFGILLYELFTGCKPITGETVDQVFYRILHDTISLEPLRDAAVPQSLIALIASCTAKDPEQRPQNVRVISMALEREIAAAPTAAPRPNKRLAFSRLTIAVVLFMLAIATVFAISYLRWTPTAEQPEAENNTAPALPSRLQTSSGEMILIPEGEFQSGLSNARETLPAFYIDRLEVTNELYGQFCMATGRDLPAGFAEAPRDFPVVNITIDEARQFARWAGKRLPTRKEWEKAARGTDGRTYPWGNDRNPGLANVDTASLAPVTAFSTSESPWRVRQMAGNAWEFVDELSTPSEKAIAIFTKLLKPPPTPDESWYLIMGGSYYEGLGEAYDAAFVPARFDSATIGFRCVKDAG